MVRVPAAEALVGALRQRHDPSARLGVPAHITLLYPFMAPERIDGAVLQRVAAALAGIAAFPFRLREVARFPATAYLAPEPAAPFVALTEALVRAFPAWLPFGGVHPAIVPHLTVANGDAGEAEAVAAELERAMQRHGAIDSLCSQVTLQENSTGLWRTLHEFPLPSAPHARPRTP